MKSRCPICGKAVPPPENSHDSTASLFPFCSDRCKLIDLGRWLDDKYQIPLEEPSDESTPLDSPGDS